LALCLALGGFEGEKRFDKAGFWRRYGISDKAAKYLPRAAVSSYEKDMKSRHAERAK
jgi:hypothetical protein